MPWQVSEASRAVPQSATVKVWDVFVRVFHWTVVVAFFVAYFTEGDFLTLHAWAGYAIGAFVVLRIAWGFAGPTHARFSDFLYSPSNTCTYLIDLIRFRAKRYLGHSPAGAAMVFALLIGLAATVWSGLELYAVEENAGPLAALSGEFVPGTEQSRQLSRDVSESEEYERGEEHDRNDEGAGEFWEELHEVLANVVLALVILHIGGVGLASFVHRENLARAMVTGRKRAQ